MWISFLSLTGTTAAYVLARAIARRFQSTVANPFLIGTVLIVSGLALSGLDYHQYRAGVEPLAFLLGPATVALGVPLYKHLPLLRQNLHTVLAGGSIGAAVGVLSVTLLAAALGLSRVLILALIPKSVTTPVALAIADVLGGEPGLTAAMTALTGFTGAAFARPLLDWVGVRSPIARGLALGVGIHGIGTVAALDEGELAAAAAGLGMTIAAITTALIAPVAAWFLPH